IRINNRLILNGYLEQHGLAHKAVAILRALDKLPKMGRESVIHEMVQEAGIPYEKAHTVVWLAEVPEATGTDVNEKTLLLVLQSYARDNEKIKEGALRLKELLKATKTAGVPEDRIRIDLSIARGLDYYTGTIFETFLTDLPGIGSVCSGGRYDNLA